MIIQRHAGMVSGRLSFAGSVVGFFYGCMLWVLSELNSLLILIRTQVKFCDVLHCFYFRLIRVFQTLPFFFSPPSKLFFLVAFASIWRLFRTASFTKITCFLSTTFQCFTCQSKTIVLQT